MNNIIFVSRHALTMAVSRHAHTSWELIYCTSGTGALRFDDRTLRYGVGDISIIPPKIPHSNISEDGFTNIYLNMDDATLPNEVQIIRGDPGGVILNAFEGAYLSYSATVPEYASLLPLHGQLITTAITARQSENAYSSIVLDIENHIHRNFADCRFDLNAYLHALPFNYEYLKKLFKKETGLTPLQYLTERRLENASRILGSGYGRMNITETANLCGFSEPLYFSRLFKKRFGVSPSKYVPEEPLRPDDPDSMKIMM